MGQDNAQQQKAKAEFKRMMVWIAVMAVILVVGAVTYLSWGDEPMRPHMIAAVILGTLISVLVGGGLMAAVFFSAKSGHDETTTGERDDDYR